MLFKTHQAFGVFTAAVVLIDVTHTPVFSAATGLGLALASLTAVMPDADLAQTPAAKIFFPLAWVLEIFKVPHRGITHSFLFAAIWVWLTSLSVHWALTAGPISIPLYPVFVAGATGYISHLTIDLLNREGEQLLWPMHWRFAFKLCSSDGLVNTASEYIFLFAFFFVIVYGLGIQYPFFGQFFNMAHRYWSVIPRT